MTGHALFVALAAGGALSVLVAYEWPSFTLAALLACSVGPELLQMTPQVQSGTFSIYRVPGPALVMLPMTAALVLRAAVSLSGRRVDRRKDRLGPTRVLATILVVWLGFEVVRTFGTYGLSSIREFANENLLLVVPLYLAVFLRSKRSILRAFKAVAVFALVAPIVLIPLVGSLKGWGLGSTDRFYPSQVSLGVFFGIVSLLVLRKYGQLRVGWWVLYLATSAGVALIVVDGHRSVWLACAAAVVALVCLGEIRLRRFWHWGFAVLGLVAALVLTLFAAGFDVPRYVVTRASAFLNPSNDPTSDWRFSIWRQALPVAREHLLAGQGFGGYYAWATKAGTTMNVAPHDTYIQLLLKTGMVGVVVAVVLGVATIVGLTFGYRVARGRRDAAATPVIVVGLAVLVAVFPWGIVYQMEMYSFVFVGLGVAATTVVCAPVEGPSKHP